jgi:hypothetical protein
MQENSVTWEFAQLLPNSGRHAPVYASTPTFFSLRRYWPAQCQTRPRMRRCKLFSTVSSRTLRRQRHPPFCVDAG